MALLRDKLNLSETSLRSTDNLPVHSNAHARHVSGRWRSNGSGSTSGMQCPLHFGPHLVERLGFVQVTGGPLLPRLLEGLFVQTDAGKKNDREVRTAFFDWLQQVQAAGFFAEVDVKNHQANRQLVDKSQ